MYVSPSSGDCAQWLEPKLTGNGERKVALLDGSTRKQSRTPTGHEPVGLNKSANGKQGEPGGRTEPWPSQRCDEITPPRARLPFPHQPLCRIAHPSRLPYGSLAPPVAALGLDGARLRCRGFKDEGMAASFIRRANRATIQQYSGVSSYFARDFR